MSEKSENVKSRNECYTNDVEFVESVCFPVNVAPHLYYAILPYCHYSLTDAILTTVVCDDAYFLF